MIAVPGTIYRPPRAKQKRRHPILVIANAIDGVDLDLPRKRVILSGDEARALEDAIHRVRIAAKTGLNPRLTIEVEV